MAPQRTASRWLKFYSDGYDLSGYAKAIGPLTFDFTAGAPDAAFSDAVEGAFPGRAKIGVGMLSSVLDNDTAGAYARHSAAGSLHSLMIPIGMGADPVMGVPVYLGQFEQEGFELSNGDGFTSINAPFSNPGPESGLAYNKPWGVLLHAKGAETAINAANTNVDNGAATTAGGYLMYQIFAVAGSGTATISVDDSANGTTWAALAGATSGAIAHTAMPTAGIIQLSGTATVRQYLRWQLALTGITSVTFALAFVRAALHNAR